MCFDQRVLFCLVGLQKDTVFRNFLKPTQPHAKGLFQTLHTYLLLTASPKQWLFKDWSAPISLSLLFQISMAILHLFPSPGDLVTAVLKTP